MDVQLQELIDKIKKDGIESAAALAEKVRADAESEAKRILDTARKEAEAILAKAKADAERTEQAGIAAVGQASRNLVLAFRAEIQGLLDAVVARETGAAYGDEVLKAAIPAVLGAWAEKGVDGLDVLLPADRLAALESYFSGKLSGELKKGLELKADRNLGAGFRIAAKDGSAYYDFSAEAVAELLSSYLNPRLAEVLKAAAKGQ